MRPRGLTWPRPLGWGIFRAGCSRALTHFRILNALRTPPAPPSQALRAPLPPPQRQADRGVRAKGGFFYVETERPALPTRHSQSGFWGYTRAGGGREGGDWGRVPGEGARCGRGGRGWPSTSRDLGLGLRVSLVYSLVWESEEEGPSPGPFPECRHRPAARGPRGGGVK